ncbi:MAG: hypothetical protein GYA55_07720, partial [SAR324 cluster bacterium]|nr:hypothetical protein [SAR324 cluster bacterium]
YDFQTIKEILVPKRQIKENGYIVVSTICDHEKILLTVGDLVDATSCQNYRNGFLISTLPGYAIDANIKVALTFAIPAGELSGNPILLSKLKRSSAKLMYKFSPATISLNIFDPDTKEEFTLPLRKALRRNILRLGVDNKQRPVILTERPYLQNHAIEKRIEEESCSLISQFRASVGAMEAKGEVEFPASRNPSGVYSDALGGAKGLYGRKYSGSFGDN